MHDQVGDHPRHGRDRARGGGGARRPQGCWSRDSHSGPVPAPDGGTPAGGPVVDPRRVRRAGGKGHAKRAVMASSAAVSAPRRAEVS
jgi:hypothetical protein